MDKLKSYMRCIYPDPDACGHAVCIDTKKQEFACTKTNLKCSYREFKPRNLMGLIIKDKEKVKHEI